MTESVRGSTRLTGRRAFLAGLAVLPFGLAGCQFINSSVASPVTEADGQAFPVSIPHAYGTTVVKSEPRRIATLGLGSGDACLALGVVPLAIPISGAQPNGSTPWFDLALRQFGVEPPLLLDETKGLPVEELKGMGPDLILAVNSTLSRADYDELSKIAPVVAFPAHSVTADWRTSLDLVGRALGRSAEVGKIRSETEEKIRAELGNYPDLPGTTFLVAKPRAALGADFEVFGEESNPVRIVKEFGLQPAPALAAIGQTGRPVNDGGAAGSYAWPAEDAAALASDMVIFALIKDESFKIASSGILDGVPAHKAGNSVLAYSTDNGLALETASCLSVAWISRTMVPELARAAHRAKHRA